MQGTPAEPSSATSSRARPEELTPEQRSQAIAEVAEMLMAAYRQLHPLPECALSVLEQCAIVSSAERAPLDSADIAMVLARSGLVLNTWCTAATMLTQTTDSPITISGLVALLGAMQPDPRYQVALLERLTATVFDNSAIRQLSTCYLHALDGYNLLELHKLIGVQDLARLRAVDLLDSASRGAVIAVHFLARETMAQHGVEPSHETDEPQRTPTEPQVPPQ